MATDVDQACYEWSHDALADRDDSQEDTFSEMLDHESISFGGYSVDSLSWEKRSVFTYNKCQEELEKVKSPGLVAQKKAYFEEYYKRIRAMKALQKNQQTELALDYSGDDSISSQTWEEEETVAWLDHFVNESTNVDYLLAKESKTLSSVEKVPPIGQLDSESMLPSHDLSTWHVEEFGNGVKSSYSIQMHHLGTESILHEPLLSSTEVTLQHDIIDLEDGGIPRKDENSILDIEPEEAAEGTVMPNIVLGIGVHKSAVCTNSEPGNLECRQVTNFGQNKNKPAIKKHTDHLALSRVKEFVASAKNGLKLERKTKSDKVKSLQGLKHPVQKITGKAEANIGSSNATSKSVSSNNKSTSVPSQKPLAEVRTSVTNPRPFSLTTERPAAAPSGSKEIAKISDTKMPHRSSLNCSRGVLNMQGSPKKTSTTNAIKNKEHGSKRCQDRAISRASAFNCQSSESIVALGRRPSKTRSVSLPASEKSNPSGSIKHRLATSIAGIKQKEIKEDSKPKKDHLLDSKLTAPPSRTSTVRSKKVSSSSNSSNTTLRAKKPHIGHLSLVVRKPSQKMPPWR